MRGYIYNLNTNYDKAISDYTMAIELSSNNADLYYDRGIAYSEKGDTNRAIEDFTMALSIDAKHSEARENLENSRR
ncbi:MAG: tetratricopeptide repeat protein [Treponema sp.]|nr:tetratricopeptide repeat protein [Treponema sp.]